MHTFSIIASSFEWFTILEAILDASLACGKQTNMNFKTCT